MIGETVTSTVSPSNVSNNFLQIQVFFGGVEKLGIHGFILHQTFRTVPKMEESENLL